MLAGCGSEQKTRSVHDKGETKIPRLAGGFFCLHAGWIDFDTGTHRRCNRDGFEVNAL